MIINIKKSITLYPCVNRRENANKPYGFDTPYPVPEGDTAQLAEAVTWDNCTIQFKNGYRKTENYLQADCIFTTKHIPPIKKNLNNVFPYWNKKNLILSGIVL